LDAIYVPLLEVALFAKVGVVVTALEETVILPCGIIE
jgi:hypothetical protein